MSSIVAEEHPANPQVRDTDDCRSVDAMGLFIVQVSALVAATAEEFARDSKYGIWFWEAHIYRSLAANCAAKADFAEAISRLSAEDGSEPNRHVIEVPDKFAIARWSREADIGEIARCILGTLKYEPHAVDTTVLRDALEGVIERAKEDAA